MAIIPTCIHTGMSVAELYELIALLSIYSNKTAIYTSIMKHTIKAGNLWGIAIIKHA